MTRLNKTLQEVAAAVGIAAGVVVVFGAVIAMTIYITDMKAGVEANREQLVVLTERVDKLTERVDDLTEQVNGLVDQVQILAKLMRENLRQSGEASHRRTSTH